MWQNLVIIVSDKNATPRALRAVMIHYRTLYCFSNYFHHKISKLRAINKRVSYKFLEVVITNMSKVFWYNILLFATTSTVLFLEEVESHVGHWKSCTILIWSLINFLILIWFYKISFHFILVKILVFVKKSLTDIDVYVMWFYDILYICQNRLQIDTQKSYRSLI